MNREDFDKLKVGDRVKFKHGLHGLSWQETVVVNCPPPYASWGATGRKWFKRPGPNAEDDTYGGVWSNYPEEVEYLGPAIPEERWLCLRNLSVVHETDSEEKACKWSSEWVKTHPTQEVLIVRAVKKAKSKTVERKVIEYVSEVENV